MTEKANDVLPADTEEEACRKLMIFLYGSEAEAMEVAEAASRYATPEEEKLIQQRCRADNEMALRTIREAGIVADPTPIASSTKEEPRLTAEEEEKFASFMEAVYRRAETPH